MSDHITVTNDTPPDVPAKVIQPIIMDDYNTLADRLAKADSYIKVLEAEKVDLANQRDKFKQQASDKQMRVAELEAITGAVSQPKIEVAIKPQIPEAELAKLRNQGWQHVHLQFTPDHKLNVVLERIVSGPQPEPIHEAVVVAEPAPTQVAPEPAPDTPPQVEIIEPVPVSTRRIDASPYAIEVGQTVSVFIGTVREWRNGRRVEIERWSHPVYRVLAVEGQRVTIDYHLGPRTVLLHQVRAEAKPAMPQHEPIVINSTPKPTVLEKLAEGKPVFQALLEHGQDAVIEALDAKVMLEAYNAANYGNADLNWLLNRPLQHPQEPVVNLLPSSTQPTIKRRPRGKQLRQEA